MKTYRLTLTVMALLIIGFAAGCSGVGFESIPKLSCDSTEVSRDQDVECYASPDTITISFTFGVGDVDILFVDDNSGSMFAEQQKMANAFPNFLSRISNLFYQMAIVTTDVSASPGNNTPRAANGYGKFQDGRFLEFTNEQNQPSGLYVLNRETPNLSGLFRGTIRRQESLVCDQNGFNASACPSSDERGIYAANLAIERGERNFFRPGAHLALVILSDEDERSQGGAAVGYPLELKDMPETLVSTMKTYYPTKSFSVHSVVTNNETCRSQQTQYSQNGGMWPTLGFIGTQYMKLSTPNSALRSVGNLLPGVVGSICASDYGAQLGNIGANISTNTINSPKSLACSPDPDKVSIVTNPTGYENQIQYTIDSQNRVYFTNLPLGVKVTFSYDCSRF